MLDLYTKVKSNAPFALKCKTLLSIFVNWNKWTGTMLTPSRDEKK